MLFSKIDPEKLYTPQEVADLWGVARNTVYGWKSSGAITYYQPEKINNSPIRFLGKDILEFMERSRRDAVA